MVALLTIALAAAVPAPAGGLPAKTCQLVTPRGDAIGFLVIPWDDNGDLGVLATEGSVWPPRPLPASRRPLEADPAAERRYALGGGTGIVLELGEPQRDAQWQSVTLFRRDGRRAGLPLAFGYCSDGRAPTVFKAMDLDADPGAIGADIPAFDPALWPQNDCALIAQDGRRLRIRYRLRDTQTAEFQSTELWGREPLAITLTRERVRRGRPVRARFERRTGPSGHEMFFADARDGSGAKLITFLELGGASARDQAGFAICGYRGMTRGPAQQ